MANVCLGAACLCAVYYVIIVLYAGITADFAWIWILGAAALLVLQFIMRYEKRHPGTVPLWLRNLFLVFFAAGVLVFCILCGRIVCGMMQSGERNLDYVVVLGAQVKGDRPSRALKKRLDKALEYAEENPDTVLILSGGQGQGEDITEAACMEAYLLEKGISRDRMVLEEKSTTTKENLVFSNEMTGCAEANTGILSNNFHVYRAMKLAQKQGYRNVKGIAAPSDPLMQPHYVLREAFALIKEKWNGSI